MTSLDWQTYRTLTLGADVPVVESVLINRPDEEAMGAGETTITLTAAAVGNAVFDATGARLRGAVYPERVKSTLAATLVNCNSVQEVTRLGPGQGHHFLNVEGVDPASLHPDERVRLIFVGGDSDADPAVASFLDAEVTILCGRCGETRSPHRGGRSEPAIVLI